MVTAAPPVGWVDVSFEPAPDEVVFPFEEPPPDGDVLLVPLLPFPDGCVVFPDSVTAAVVVTFPAWVVLSTCTETEINEIGSWHK